MATMDILCVVVLVLFGILGAVRGFIRQAFSLLAFLLIAVLAAPVGVAIAGPDATTNVKIWTSLGTALVIYILTKIVGAATDEAIGSKRSAEGEPRPAPWNSYCGAALAVIKAGLLCWLILCFFTAFREMVPGVTAFVQDSCSVKTTRLFNPFAHWIRPETRRDMERALIALWEIKRHPATWSKVIKEKSIQRVLKHDRLRKLLDQGKGDLIGALADEGFQNSLAEIDWGNVANIAGRALSEIKEE